MHPTLGSLRLYRVLSTPQPNPNLRHYPRPPSAGNANRWAFNMLNEKMLLKELSEIKRRDGIVSIFWITSSQARARRIQWLQDNGVIVPMRQDKRDAFPNCVFSVHEERLTLRALNATTESDKS